MHRDRLISTTFALLSILAAVAFAATTRKPSTGSKKDCTLKKITLPIGDGGNSVNQCYCTIYNLCDAADTIHDAVGVNGETCDNNNVCCVNPWKYRTTTESLINTSPKSDYSTPTSSPLPSTNTYVQPTSQTNDSQICQCVSSSQCSPFEQPKYGVRLLKPRAPCTSPNICCPLDHIRNSTWTPTTKPPIPQTETPPPPTTSVPPNVDQCGIRGKQLIPRISMTDDLMDTSFGEFPWMALLLTTEINADGSRMENVFVCGASVLAPNIILTAAHCVKGIDINLLKVRVGEHDTQSTSEPFPYQERRVSAIHVHEKFHSKFFSNDLALLQLTEDIRLASHISTICAPLMSSPYAAPNSYNPNSCVAIGWGKNASEVGVFHTIMKMVDLAIVPRDECERRLKQSFLSPNFQLHSSFICAIGQGGADTCDGDGGGPLVCELKNEPNRYIQVGVIAAGVECGSKIPAVYASLEANNLWLSTMFNSINVFKLAPP